VLFAVVELLVFIAPRKSFDILALYKSDYYYYYYYYYYYIRPRPDLAAGYEAGFMQMFQAQ